MTHDRQEPRLTTPEAVPAVVAPSPTQTVVTPLPGEPGAGIVGQGLVVPAVETDTPEPGDDGTDAKAPEPTDQDADPPKRSGTPQDPKRS